MREFYEMNTAAHTVLLRFSLDANMQTAPAFGERVDQWREASIISTLTKEGHSSPLVTTPLLLLTAEDDFHFGEDAQELEKWLVAAGHVSLCCLQCPRGIALPNKSSMLT